MARNRTRLAKLKAAARRQEALAQVAAAPASPGPVVAVPAVSEKVTLSKAVQDVFGYPLNLIYKDLAKTVIVTSLMIIGIIAFAVWSFYRM